ncbi:type II secretion system protein, partial [bacterium]|nr:type II secretion system protein [bacterium]
MKDKKGFTLIELL